MCLKLTQIHKYTSWTACLSPRQFMCLQECPRPWPDLSEDPESDADYEEVW